MLFPASPFARLSVNMASWYAVNILKCTKLDVAMPCLKELWIFGGHFTLCHLRSGVLSRGVEIFTEYEDEDEDLGGVGCSTSV